MLSRLFAPRRRKNQEDVAGRAAEVIVQVLFDVGIDRFINGSFVLDRHFRLRFYSAAPPFPQDAIAELAVREVDEALVLRTHARDTGLDGPMVARHARGLTDGVMRALLQRSPELRALPSTRVKRRLHSHER